MKRRTFHWSYESWILAKRLGLRRVAIQIHNTSGPWIIPTARAEFALRAAGMWPVVEVQDPLISVTEDPYR